MDIADVSRIPDAAVPAALTAAEAALNRAEEIDRALADLHAAEAQLAVTEQNRRAVYEREQADADKLNKRTLRTWLLSVTDRLDSRRDKEAFEAAEAERAWKQAADELSAVTEKIRRLEEESAGLPADRETYDRLLDRFAGLIADGALPAVGDSTRLRRETARLNARCRQYAETEKAARQLVTLCGKASDALYDLNIDAQETLEYLRTHMGPKSASGPLMSYEQKKAWTRELDFACEQLDSLDGYAACFSSDALGIAAGSLPRTGSTALTKRLDGIWVNGDSGRLMYTTEETERMMGIVGDLKKQAEQMAAQAGTARAEALARRDRLQTAAARFDDAE